MKVKKQAYREWSSWTKIYEQLLMIDDFIFLNFDFEIAFNLFSFQQQNTYSIFNIELIQNSSYCVNYILYIIYTYNIE